MCGIVGSFFGHEESHAVRRGQAALDLLTHRGPDDRGLEAVRVAAGQVVLGQTRLSVIDLSERAHQPMYSTDGRFLLVFNGEIYNHQELRAQLQSSGHGFRSSSDTEVLLQAWAAWGEAALPRFVGMFSFVLLDRESGLLHGARDAFGIKPLYYQTNAQGFGFASELPALQALGVDGHDELDWQTAYDYLAHGSYDTGERTFFRNTRALPAGHSFCYDTTRRRFTSKAWWQPKIFPVQRISIDDAAQELRRLLLDSVRLHLRSDVPLGTALSGGLDSSAIVGCMRHLEPDIPIHTFSFIASGNTVSEERWIDLVNTQANTIAHKVVIAPQELATDLDDMIAAQGEPFGSTSIYAQYRIFRLVREQGVTVTLDGQGADELCGGYAGYPGPRIRSLLDKRRWGESMDFLKAWGQWPGRSSLDGIKATVAEYAGPATYQILRKLNGAQNAPAWLDANVLTQGGVLLRFPHPRPAITMRGRRMCAELARSLHGTGLPELLRHGDRNSMRFSVESRVPFLTTALADFLLTLPEEYLVAANGETKHLLRRAMRGLVPDEVLARRDKIGFATPEQAWLRQITPQVREWLRHPIHLPFFRQDEVLKVFDQVMAGQRPFSWQVWRWINFTRWYARQRGG